jgi:hypothetical protein
MPKPQAACGIKRDALLTSATVPATDTDTDTSPSHGRARETGLTRFFERAPFETVARIKPNLVERRNKRIIVIDCDRSI